MIPQTRQSCACIRALVFLGILLPSSSFFFRRIPPLEQELGCSPTLSRVLGKENYFFDPLSFASDENFARYREAELKHGRVAMLAIIGMVAPGVKGKSLTALEVLKSLKPSQYLEILGTCAFLEAFVFVQQDAKDMPGMHMTCDVLRCLFETRLFLIDLIVNLCVRRLWDGLLWSKGQGTT